MANETFLTKEGKAELETRLDYLIKVKRAEMAERVKLAREFGDISENAEYDAAKDEQGMVEDEIKKIDAEIRAIKGRVCEFHAKDAKFMLGQGRVDFKRVREAMDEIEFAGWIQIEAAAPKGLVEDYRTHAAFLRGIFA